MRRKILATFIATSLTLPIAMSAGATSQMAGDAMTAHIVRPAVVNKNYSVHLNKTQIVYLPEPASAVVVGNPDIADVSVHSADTIFIVGRGFGETNIIVLNRAGHTIMESNVEVASSGSRNNVRVYSGSNVLRSTYSCTPYCQPAPVLGDENTFISNNTTKADDITNTFATGSTVTRAPSANSATIISSPNGGQNSNQRGREN